MNIKKLYTIFILVFVLSGAIFAENFGRNKVQYEHFHWRFIETGNFDIYFVEGYESLARLGGEILEDAYIDVSSDLGQRVVKPVPVIIYPSPGGFQETNITTSILGEGTGGFTESFKTRVVLPFNGSYEDFRHVLVHEMAHSVTFDMLLGRGPVSLLSANRIFQLPLWMAEGISEWESICWDVESDMYLRDAVLNNYIRPLSNLQGFLAYKEGASVIGYLARRYGRRKIGEILGKGQIHIVPDNALKAAIGRTQPELFEDWLNIKKREYFPEFGIRQRPVDIAERVTDHTVDGTYFNVMPSFSPDGYRVVYLSDRDDYIDMFVVDIITGKTDRIARGQRSGEAESFHPFRSRPGWSEKGEYLAYSSKSGGKDDIIIRETEHWKEYRRLVFDNILEVSSPAFVPGDTAIIFGGLSLDQADLYLVRFDGSSPIRLTDDRWDDNFPSVSPDGRYLAFSSDRPVDAAYSDAGFSEPEQAQVSPTENIYPEKFPYGKYNIWIIDMESDSIRPMTTDGAGNGHPVWSPDGRTIAYTSERNGIRNIWIAEFEGDMDHRPITDLLSGAFCPSWDPDGNSMVFSAFYDGGFDIYEIKELSGLDSLVPTTYILAADTLCPTDEIPPVVDSKPRINGDLRRYPATSEDRHEPERKPDWKSRGYRPQFSVDLVTGALGYNTYYGFTGQTYLMFSDVMGNHKALIATDLLENLENSTIFLDYAYLAHRVDFGATGYHYMTYFWDNYDRIFSDRVFGGGIYADYPFNQFDRFGISFDGFVVKREFHDVPSGTVLPDDVSPFNLRLSAGLTRDNSLWSGTGPVAGSRLKLAVEYVPETGDNSMDYYAGRVDLRRYIHFGRGYGFTTRLAAGAARGEKPPLYWLGGSESWLNWKLASDDIYSLRDIYFSRTVLPLRGHKYFAYTGQTYALANIEIRYPFIERIRLGMPPVVLGGINGALFADIGAVTGTDLSEFRGWRNDRLDDIKMGIGVGARAWVWMFLVRYDLAWETDLFEIADKPYHHFSLGAEF